MRTTIASLVLALALVSGCSDDDDEDPRRSTTTTVERTTSTAAATTTSLTREQEVEAAYLRSWEVYARAAFTFDTSELHDVYAKEALQTVLDEIARSKANREPSKIVVEHDYHIVFLSPTLANVSDNYRNHSVILDPDTGQPAEADPNEIVHDNYTMELIGGAWKVTFIARSE